MSEYLYFIMLTAGLAAFGGLSFWLKEQLRGSREQFESAHNFGASFEPASENKRLFIEDLSQFALFRVGVQENIRNLMTGTTEGVETLVFVYFHHSTLTTNASAARYLVAVFIQWTWDIPDLRISPSTILDKFKALVGFTPITFQSRPAVSIHYTLYGPDEAAIRALFRPDVLEFFASHPSSLWRPYPAIEGHGPRLVVFQRASTFLGNTVPPTLFLSDARRILAVFRNAFPPFNNPHRRSLVGNTSGL